jgi:hypothetical protein
MHLIPRAPGRSNLLPICSPRREQMGYRGVAPPCCSMSVSADGVPAPLSVTREAVPRTGLFRRYVKAL